MRVVLFDNINIVNSMAKNLGRLEKSPILRFSYEEITKILGEFPDSRKYEEILGCKYDNYFLIEKLGLCKSTRKTIVEVDLTDSLDLVISALTGADPKNVRKMKNYHDVSKSLLTLDYKGFDIPLDNFYNLDDNLDNYLNCVVSDNAYYTMKLILQNFLQKIQDIIMYTGLFLQDKYQLVLRSIGRARFILTTDLPIEDGSLEIVSPNGYSCEVPFSTSPKLSYKELVDYEIAVNS